MRRDLVCAAMLLGLAAAYYALARNLDATALSDAIGPAGLPLIYAAVLAGLAAAIGGAAVLRSARAHTRALSGDGAPASRLTYRMLRAAGALLIGVLYLTLAATIGYLLATALALAAMAIYQGERVTFRVGLVAVIGAAVLYALFDVLLGVPMPAPWSG